MGVKVKNRKSKYNLLYLPDRVVQFMPKETKNLYKKDVNTEEFKNRVDDFRVIEENKNKEKSEVQKPLVLNEVEEKQEGYSAFE